MSSQDDESTGIALGVVFSLIVLVVGLVLGIALYKSGSKPARPAAVASVPAAADAASVKVENGVVKFYFASAKSDLASGANEALAEVVKAAQAGKTLAVSGFHDATGDAVSNAELAKQRALAVRDALKALGVADDRISLKKPEQLAGTGSNAEARRVEVVAQ